MAPGIRRVEVQKTMPVNAGIKSVSEVQESRLKLFLVLEKAPGYSKVLRFTHTHI